MKSGRNARGYGFGGENGTERKTRGERFGDYDDVGFGRKFLIAEVTAGAAEATLDFVGDEKSAVLSRERACAIPERFADRVDTAFALNGFEDYGAHGVIEFGFEIGDVIEADKFDARDDGGERLAIFFGGGDADGAECAAMERI